MPTLDIVPQQAVTCTGTGHQASAICVPVTVTPFAVTGTTTTVCCGGAVITPGIIECPGTPNGNCVFTITQNLCTTVPIEFGATALTGTPSVTCGRASNVNICANCGTA